MYVNHKLSMDLSGPAVLPKVDMVQRDQYVRHLTLTLFNNREPWEIPQGIHPIICYQKADGTGGEYDTLPDGRRAWESAGNTLTVEIAPQMLTHPGPVRMAVDLLQGDAKLSTFCVLLYVQKAIPLGLPSGDYFKLEGFLPIPEKGEAGQLLRICGVSDAGQVTAVEGYDLSDALEEAKESGLFSGKSAYEVALDNGFVGTEAEWLESLKGKGISAALGNIAQINITGQLTTDYNVIVDFNGSRLQRVKDPVADTDGVNKAYVDRALANAGSATVPAYWDAPLAEAEQTVQLKQDTGGREAISFVWFSDMALSEGESAALGQLAAKIMESCAVPIAVFSGGAVANGLVTENAWRSALKSADRVFSEIGADRVLRAQGVTDGSRGAANGIKIHKDTAYNSLFRRQEEDRRRVFGTDGTYYYLDFPVVKLRLVVLNCCHYQSGTTRFGFRNDQIHWFAHSALDLPEEGWALAFVSHLSPEDSRVYDGGALLEVLSAFEDGRSFQVTAGTEGTTEYVSVSGDFSGQPGGEIVGFFCGGSNSDEIGETGSGYQVVTIRNAVQREEGVSGTDEEYALDIVTINRRTDVTSLTRLGAGASRSFHW